MGAALTRLRGVWRSIDRRDPFALLVALFVIACLAGANWDVPCTDAWHNDALAPRPAGLGAVVETWHIGHFFRYPPLQLLLLTLLAVPWIVLGVIHAGPGQDALLHELIEPRYMTPIDLMGRALTLLMAVGLIFNVRRLFSRIAGDRAGLAAAAVTALNPVLVYFAHSANSDVPCLFWSTLALVELDRVAAGEPRERRAMLCVCAALLTKDQSLPIFLLAAPWALLVAPIVARGERSVRDVVFRGALWRAIALSVGVYLLVAGAITNPTGYLRRIAWITGPANHDWVAAGRDTMSAWALTREVLRSVPLFGSRAIALMAVVGLVASVSRGAALHRVRAALPAVAALSYLVFFVLASRWTMERHLLPLAIFTLGYAGVAVDLATRDASPRVRLAVLCAFAAALAPQLLDVASVDGTLAVDSRHLAQRFLSGLPAGTTLEVYGGNQYLPNLPQQLRVTRVGPEPDSERSPLPGVTELRAPYADVSLRAPEYALVGEDFASFFLPTRGALNAHDARLNNDPDGRALMSGLLRGTIGYHWALRARCELPWPLRCVRMHRSTGAETWIFRRAPPSG